MAGQQLWLGHDRKAAVLGLAAAIDGAVQSLLLTAD